MSITSTGGAFRLSQDIFSSMPPNNIRRTLTDKEDPQRIRADETMAPVYRTWARRRLRS